jgi:hypothetical protein
VVRALTVSILAPSAGQTITSQDVQVRILASSTAADVASVTIFVDAKPVRTVGCSSETCDVSVSLPVSKGIHSLAATAVDTAGNGGSTTLSFTKHEPVATRGSFRADGGVVRDRALVLRRARTARLLAV